MEIITASKNSVEQAPRDAGTIIAASILGADQLNLGRDLQNAEDTGEVAWVQVDVMDGRFCPNMAFGPETIAAIAQQSALFIDVHLMVERPKALLPLFAQKGADLITVHAEAKDSPKECLRLIRKLGKYAGLAIKPKTPVKKILPLLPEIDLLLIMTVEPGFAGQKFIESCVPKIRQAREAIKKSGSKVSWIEVDGGIGEASIPAVVAAGANVLVCGSSLFREAPSITVPRLWQTIRQANASLKIS